MNPRSQPPSRRVALRAIPAVEKVLQALGDAQLPRALVVATVRRELAGLRARGRIPDEQIVLDGIRENLAALRRSRLQRVINGTGVVIHTNLGRAPMGRRVAEALELAATDYSNLELDLETGERGQRGGYIEKGLATLCGAQAATVVNNCAAALVLVLRHFTRSERKEVILSRGELVQIGGGFRIPEILEESGALLREVGTTNRTTLEDYSRAIGPPTALVLKVHRSNFFMGGFVESPTVEELSALARRRRIPLVEDLGSGAVVDTAKLGGVEHEPTPIEALKRGADLVCFSGDKLLGGPQAGIIVGANRLVAALKREPFFRALRCDKLILTALQATVDLYLDSLKDPDVEALPTLGLLSVAPDSLETRAQRILEQLAGLPCRAVVGKGKAQVGGGTLPKDLVESATVDLTPHGLTLSELATRLRLPATGAPVVGYVSGGKFRINLRTVFPRQDDELVAAIRQAVGGR